ncbi:gas vesicle protein K [Actinocrinis puniceicyclus]|uniref:Gas vesicle protein K n=1 Tax=Actinocrinis puniceicyclus TaxID=977794 RepID=A0A8J7WQI2_9ACTN|nr:gas vesicle protein K [Actinocrinis puniceicyclus]
MAPRAEGSGAELSARIDADAQNVERSLVALVLTLVELLRQLMERQAIRRLDAQDLTDEQIERIGGTLMALEDRMAQLREHFGLSPEDLNIDLGPLGRLLPDP